MCIFILFSIEFNNIYIQGPMYVHGNIVTEHKCLLNFECKLDHTKW